MSARQRDDGDDEVHRCRASPKHYDDMTEVCNRGGGHCTRLKDQLVCSRVPPAPVYKGGEEEASQQGARQGEGSPTRTPVPVGFGPTLFPSTGGGKGEGEGVGEGKGGGAPFPSPIRPPPLWGAHQPLVGWLASLLWPIRPISFLGGFR